MTTGQNIAAVVGAFALLSTYGTGVWFIADLVGRVERLEENKVWKASVDNRLNTHAQRWGQHFQLFGDEIRARVAAQLNQ